MEKVRRQGKSLRYITVHPDGYDPQKLYPLIILLHGYGSNMHDLAGLAPSIHSKGYVYICPNAPLPVPLGPGLTGFSWTPLPEAMTFDDILAAQDALSAFVDEVMEEYHATPGQILLGGFSQGGMMTYQLGLPRPGLFGGLMALSTRIADPEELRSHLPRERNQPIFIAHGAQDPLIPVDQAHQTREFLEAEGYKPQYKEYAMGHDISQEVLKDLVQWIQQVLPPVSEVDKTLPH